MPKPPFPLTVTLHRTPPTLARRHLTIRQRVAIHAKPLGTYIPARTTSKTPTQRVDHGRVADDDRDEGFAAGPAAGLLGAVYAGLFSVDTFISIVGSG
ncbi:hypothetical protein BBP40_011237, partial [Aspergillus hancockii]